MTALVVNRHRLSRGLNAVYCTLPAGKVLQFGSCRDGYLVWILGDQDKGRDNVRQFLVVGDHEDLPPVEPPVQLVHRGSTSSDRVGHHLFEFLGFESVPK